VAAAVSALAIGPTFCLRPGRRDDRDYVVSSWQHGAEWRYGRTITKMGPSGVNLFARDSRMRKLVQRRCIQRLLERDDTILTCAVDPSDSESIFGWSATSKEHGPVVHYVYVRDGLRRQGIGRALVAHVGVTACVYTNQPTDHHVPIPAGWTYDAYRMWPE
jgi:hypothetical protein